MTASILTFHPDGTVGALWTDALPLGELGPMTVRRASWIDFNEHTQQWEVRFDPHADNAEFSHASRAECLRWEQETLNQ